MDYKKKLEEAKRLYETANSDQKYVLESLFPELKESEDERIKKEIIEFLLLPHPQFVGKRNHEEWIAWLEKQGQVKESPISQHENKKCKENDVSLTSEDEPKFKVGDWVTNGDYTWKIIDVKVLDYILQSQNGEIVDDTISYVDEEFNLWVIKDAKDGDVLSTPKKIFIYNGNYNTYSNALGGYCSVKHNGRGLFIPEEDEECRDCIIMGISDATPATKEQCDTLMKAISDAGYAFDFEKKELNIID